MSMDGFPEEGINRDEEIRALMSLFRRLRHQMRRPGTVGKQGEMSVMGVVSFHYMETGEGLRTSEIAQALGISPPSVTRFINGLEAAGWVQREMDPEDRRSVLVSLTPEGERKHQCFQTKMLDVFGGLALHLGNEDARHLVRIMERAFDYLEERMHREHAPHEPEANTSAQHKGD